MHQKQGALKDKCLQRKKINLKQDPRKDKLMRRKRKYKKALNKIHKKREVSKQLVMCGVFIEYRYHGRV